MKMGNIKGRMCPLNVLSGATIVPIIRGAAMDRGASFVRQALTVCPSNLPVHLLGITLNKTVETSGSPAAAIVIAILTITFRTSDWRKIGFRWTDLEEENMSYFQMSCDLELLNDRCLRLDAFRYKCL